MKIELHYKNGQESISNMLDTNKISVIEFTSEIKNKETRKFISFILVSKIITLPLSHTFRHLLYHILHKIQISIFIFLGFERIKAKPVKHFRFSLSKFTINSLIYYLFKLTSSSKRVSDVVIILELA